MPLIQIWLKDNELHALSKKAKEKTITQFIRETIVKEVNKK